MTGNTMTDYRRVIETIKDRLDIVALVSERVPLKRRGRNWVGLCPFHAEKTPSFTVSPEKQMFYCFGCGAGGDAITFWMKIENLDFADAVKDLADRLGIEIPKKVARGPSKWEAYHEINRTVQEYFHKILTAEERGRIARSYLKKRGLSLDTIEAFELGFAPDSYGLKDYLEKKGHHPQDAVPIGLLKKTDTETYVPVFRNRIMFPIVDERGRSVGFGGRVLGDRLPKYLNTPDSMIFQKGRLFYGEAQTRREISKQRLAILVEGYLDLISLYQLGIKNGIAALGTAFTDFHANRLKRWAERVVLLFDGDEAGHKASSRALEKLTRAGLVAMQGVLPEGKDPGDYLTPPNGNALKGVIDRAEDAILYRIQRASERKDGREGIQDQERLIKESLRFLGLIPDSVRLDLYVKKAEEILGLKKEILYNIIKNSERNSNLLKVGGKTARGGESLTLRRARRPFLPGKRMEDPEEVVLTSLIQRPDLSDVMIEEGALNLFSNPVLKSLGKVILEEIRDRGEISESALMQRLDEKEKAQFSRLMVNEVRMTDEQARRAFFDGLNRLHTRNLKVEIAELDRQIRELEKSGDFEQTITLLKRREAVKKSYHHVLNSNHKSR